MPAANKQCKRRRPPAAATAVTTARTSSQQQQTHQSVCRAKHYRAKAQLNSTAGSKSDVESQPVGAVDCADAVDSEDASPAPSVEAPTKVPLAQFTEAEVRFMGFPIKPMVKCGNAYYRAEILEVDWDRECVKLSYAPDSDPESEHFWLPFSSKRIWKGSYAHRHWERVGLGAWIPLIPRNNISTLHFTTVAPQPLPKRPRTRKHVVEASEAPASAMKHEGSRDAPPAAPAAPAAAMVAHAVAVPLQHQVDSSSGQHPLPALLQQLQGPAGVALSERAAAVLAQGQQGL